MNLTDVTVEVFFDISATGGDFFTLDDPVKGELDAATYVLGGDFAVDVTGDTRSVDIRRGRNRQLNVHDPGSCSVMFNNMDRDYDPTHVSSPYAGEVVPGKRIRVKCESASMFDGYVEDWNLDYNVSGLATAYVASFDELARLGARELAAHTATAQLAGARVSAVLNRGEIAYSGGRDIDAGNADLQADTVEIGTNALGYLQTVARSEQGALFVSKEGVLRFVERTALLNQMATLTFGSAEIPFQHIAVDYGTESLYNRVSVNRVGGTAQTSSDAASQMTYGVRAINVDGLLYDTDAQSEDTADYILNRYKDPELRITQITVQARALSDANRGAVLALDLTDIVAVVFSPPGGGADIERTCLVEGITHSVSPSSHLIAFDLGDANFGQFFILDDATFGVLDTNSLAY